MKGDRQDRLRQLRQRLAQGDIAGARRVVESAGAGPVQSGRAGSSVAGATSGPLVGADDHAGQEDSTPPESLTRPDLRDLPRLGEYSGPRGVCAHVRQSLREALPEQAGLARQFKAILRGARQRWDELAAPVQLCHLADADVHEVLLLDVLTLGAKDSRWVWMAGLMQWQDRDLWLDHFVARPQSEAPAVLEALSGRLERSSVVVSFGGAKGFWPLLQERMERCGVAPWSLPVHMDLLGPARQLWKGALPNGRRETLEQRLWGRSRRADGWRILAAAAAMTAGDDRPARGIVRQGQLDLAALGRLLCAVLTGCEDLSEPDG